MNLSDYSIDELKAMREATVAEEGELSEGVAIIDNVITHKEADEYAHQAENEAYPDSTGTLT